MKYSSIPSAQTVVHHCKENGIKNIVISPGSRNAPLTIGFTEDSFFSCFSIVDERCAAFFALGIAQQLLEPVVVLCSSGSALLNYYPAIAEAFYSDIPLVVISADRPSYKIDIGDGQTIRQKNVFEKHIGYTANLKQDVSHATNTIRSFGEELFPTGLKIDAVQMQVQSYNDAELQKALSFAVISKTPVHINVPFEEPLYETLDAPSVIPFILEKEEFPVKIDDLKEFTDAWNTATRKMVLVGVNRPNTVEQQFLDELAEDGSVIVLTETTSNLHHPNFYPSIDSIVASIEKAEYKDRLFKALQPDILLTFGGLVVSKKIKAFLRTYTPKHHWHVDKKKANNTFYCLSHHFKLDINTFFNKFLEQTIIVDSNYGNYWASVRQGITIKREEYIRNLPYSDFLVFSKLIAAIPENYQLQLANSSTVRYAQLFNLKPSINVFCNRGTSGIDGSTSTAIGAALYYEQPTVLFTGDLSFFYDSNGLWNNYIKPSFRIIVINNAGGGIFRILPGQEETHNYETFFETTHNLNAKNLCTTYGIEYSMADSEETLENGLQDFYKNSERPKLLEVNTPRLLNNKILLSYFDFIS